MQTEAALVVGDLRLIDPVLALMTKAIYFRLNIYLLALMMEEVVDAVAVVKE